MLLDRLPARMIFARLSARAAPGPRPSATARSITSPSTRCEVARAHFGGLVVVVGEEAALRQPALQRHLAAFEADLVETARARLLALVAAARGLAQARADAAADAAAVLLARPRRA